MSDKNPLELTPKERSQLSTIFFPDDTRTQQHMADECNINTIVKRFGLTGTVPVGVRLPEYGDFTGVVDYQSALNAIMAADKSFNSLPAHVRKEFDNDPQVFLDFSSNPDNIEKLRDLGLAPRPVIKDEPPKPVTE